MTRFKDHKVIANQLLGVIPEGLLIHLSATTSVDYYSKVLQGQKMFYLLMYGILENDRLSQRSLEDTFNDSIFGKHGKIDPVGTDKSDPPKTAKIGHHKTVEVDPPKTEQNAPSGFMR